jgi:hypothetical protein
MAPCRYIKKRSAANVDALERSGALPTHYLHLPKQTPRILTGHQISRTRRRCPEQSIVQQILFPRVDVYSTGYRREGDAGRCSGIMQRTRVVEKFMRMSSTGWRHDCLALLLLHNTLPNEPEYLASATAAGNHYYTSIPRDIGQQLISRA